MKKLLALLLALLLLVGGSAFADVNGRSGSKKACKLG